MIRAMPELPVSTIKNKLRSEIWNSLEEHNLARFPRPVYDRIPNFAGAEKAAVRIRELKEFIEADVVKVNPDAPQAYVRQIVLEEGKTLLMPTRRISAGFLRLDSKRIPQQMIRKAISISGAFKMGQRITVSKLPTVDLIIAGSVAVSLEGGRIGKGEGYSEIEYGVLRESGLVDDKVRIATTVHDCQLVDAFPVERHDLPVDYVLPPTKLYETKTRLSRPKGIYWELVTPEMLRKIPVLAEVRAKSQPK
jgi:5-formyltetrahydrofolate cyclo-ligase